MNAKILRIPVLVVGMALTLPGCLKDNMQSKSSQGSSSGAYEEPVPDNAEIDAKTFSALNLEYPGLEQVKAAIEAEQWGAAALELQRYYRNRSHVTNPNVNLLTPSISATEQSYAEYALKENGYRFYVKGYFEDTPTNTIPYSYKGADGGIDWKKYNSSGEQEQLYQIHRHQWFVAQAKAYKISGDEKYLRSWMEVYDSWWQSNPMPARCVEGENNNAIAGWIPLSVAARVMNDCDLIEYYKWADGFTPAYLTRFLSRVAAQVEFIKNNYWTDSNHRISQAQAVTIAGVLFPEMKNASEWVTNGSTILNEEIEKQHYPDGWLKDNDLSYHIGSIESYRQAMLVATVNNQQSRFDANYIAAIRRMVEVEKYLIYPNYASYNGGTDYNYSVPNMGDSRAISFTRNVLLRHMRTYRDLFPDDQGLKWLASQGGEGQVPETGIKCFPDGGHYAIRNGWTKDATMMVVVNAAVSPAERWHRQWDNNSFELYVNGRQFFPDSGVFTYGGSSETNADRVKYAASLAHTTLTLDGQNMTTCKGRSLKVENGAQTDLLVLENPSYTDLTHRRAIFFVDHKFFVIVDEGYGTGVGMVGLNFQLLPGSDSEVILDLPVNGAHTAFADKNNLFIRTFASDKVLSTAERVGFLAVNTGLTVPRKAYQANLRKESTDPAARFVTVIYPTQEKSLEISASFADKGFSATGAAVKVSIAGRVYNLSYTL